MMPNLLLVLRNGVLLVMVLVMATTASTTIPAMVGRRAWVLGVHAKLLVLMPSSTSRVVVSVR